MLCLFPSHLTEGTKFFATITTAKWLLLSAVGRLMLTELLRGEEALVTPVAGEQRILLNKKIKKYIYKIREQNTYRL